MKKGIGLSLLTISVLFGGNQIEKLSAQQLQKYYQVDAIKTQKGVLLDRILINGPQKAPLPVAKGFSMGQLQTSSTSDSSSDDGSIEAASESASVTLLNAPGFSWSFGCSATTGAMIAGYYDRTGYPYVYAGPTNEGKMPMDNSSWPDWTDSNGDNRHQTPLSATHDGLDGRVGRGHVDDYWIAYDNADDDPFITNGWDEHTYGDCTADYMKTNQTTNYGNSDGATTFYYYSDSGDPLTAEAMEANGIESQDGAYGLKLFFESRGYTVTTLYNQKIDAVEDGGFTFDQYKAEIDAGHPVFIHLTGHTVAGIGYDDENSTIYLHDTWDYDVHSMNWGGSYSGMDHQSVSVIHLASNIVPNDFNKDGIPDILFRNKDTGKNLIFFLYETGVRASYAYTTSLSDSWEGVGIGDFNGDGISDILFRNQDSGENLIYFQNADGTRNDYAYTTKISSSWNVKGIGDFNGDSISDILFRNQSTGENLIYFQSADGTRASYAYTTKISDSWDVGGVADMNNDGIADILFRNQDSGENLIYFQSADGTRASYAYTTKISSSWDIAGMGDFNKDGITDILFRNQSTGENLIFFQNEDGTRASYAYTSKVGSDWKVAGVADYNGDKIADIFFRNESDGRNLIFFQNADGTRASYKYSTKISTGWSVIQ